MYDAYFPSLYVSTNVHTHKGTQSVVDCIRVYIIANKTCVYTCYCSASITLHLQLNSSLPLSLLFSFLLVAIIIITRRPSSAPSEPPNQRHRYLKSSTIVMTTMHHCNGYWILSTAFVTAAVCSRIRMTNKGIHGPCC